MTNEEQMWDEINKATRARIREFNPMNEGGPFDAPTEEIESKEEAAE